MTTSFRQKQVDAAKRGIAFNFTQDQWDKFVKMATHCAYTNSPFGNGPSAPTVERIDPTKPYEPTNCVWVLQRVNAIKEHYFDNPTSITKTNIKQEHKPDVNRLRKILTPNGIKTILKPYLDEYGITDTPVTNEVSDVEVAEMYFQVVKRLTRSGMIVKLTLGEFKRTITRKKCQISGKELPAIGGRDIVMIDVKGEFTKDNVRVVSKEVANLIELAREVEIGESGLTKISEML